MTRPTVEVENLKTTAAAVSDIGYFVDALGKLIATIGGEDPCLCDRALDGYTVGGLMAGLRVVGSELQGHGDHLEALINQAEAEHGGGAE
ncbi:hypothetical protein [Pseudomonas mosselii]|uniref:hypothetical protein n=1 Tax=Pseudomonas mosselii TaxID=78327 RepID=UPI001F420ED0|nr:hypothetical protein [Pseudomonas mosselii]